MSTTPVLAVPVKTGTVFNIALLALVGCTSRMIGEYLREAAVLLLVFIPLDLWKHSEVTGIRILEVVFISLGVLGVGMFLEWCALLCKRVQNDLEVL